LTAVTALMFASDRGKPDDKLIRLALCRWGFNSVDVSLAEPVRAEQTKICKTSPEQLGRDSRQSQRCRARRTE
jgi:hypothetical protein